VFFCLFFVCLFVVVVCLLLFLALFVFGFWVCFLFVFVVVVVVVVVLGGDVVIVVKRIISRCNQLPCMMRPGSNP